MRPTPSCEAYIDGASRGNPGPAGVGVVLINAQTGATHEFSKSIGETTNNVTEYLALLCAMQEALRLGCRGLTVKTDSQLLARQITGVYRVRNVQLRRLHDLIMQLRKAYRRFEITHIPRTQNRSADRLAGQAARGRASGPLIL